MDYVSEAEGVVTSAIGDIGEILFSGLGTLLGLVAVLIGLFFVIKLIKRYISRGK